MTVGLLDDLRVDKLVCPECVAAGMPAEEAKFEDTRRLGLHRYRQHGVAGAARKPKRPKKNAPAARSSAKKRASTARRRAKPAAVPVAAVPTDPPEGLNEFEYAAWRLGSLQTLLAVRGETFEPVVRGAFEAEIAYHEFMLAE